MTHRGRGGKGRINYLRSAKGKLTQRPMEAIPLGPGPMNGTVTEQIDRTQAYAGHLGTNINYKWLFALTPEGLEMGEAELEPGMYIGPEVANNQTWAKRLRLTGFKGDLWFTPQLPAGGEFGTAGIGALYGHCGIGMAKFRAGALTGTQAVYPWGDFTEANAYFTANYGLGPHPSAALTDPDSLYNADLRSRRGSNVMWHRTYRWRMEIEGVWYDSDALAVDYYGAARTWPVKLALPRKFLADVGQGEALGVWFWCKDFGTSAGNSGSPIGRLDYPDLRVQYRELDG